MTDVIIGRPIDTTSIAPTKPKPRIVCLCGSTKFRDAFYRANLEETLAGKVVLSVGGFMHSDKVITITPAQKRDVDCLHLHKIDLADEVLFLNVEGYIGESTARELAYAVYRNKLIRWLEKPAGDQYLIRERHLLGTYVAAFIAQ